MCSPCGSRELHWGESAEPLERRGHFACRENGWREMKELGFERSTASDQIRAPLTHSNIHGLMYFNVVFLWVSVITLYTE